MRRGGVWGGLCGDTGRLPVVGCSVTEIRVDYAFTLILDDSWMLRIECPLVVTSGSSEPTVVDPSPDPDVMGPLLSLLGSRVSDARATADGALSLSFSTGVSIDVPVDPDFEAWILVADNGEQLIALPGGDTAYFGPNRPGPSAPDEACPTGEDGPAGDRAPWPAEGQDAIQLRVARTFRVCFEDGSELCIGSPFAILAQAGDGSTTKAIVDFSRDPTALRPALRVVNHRVTRVLTPAAGTVVVSFDDGTSLLVASVEPAGPLS